MDTVPSNKTTWMTEIRSEMLTFKIIPVELSVQKFSTCDKFFINLLSNNDISNSFIKETTHKSVLLPDVSTGTPVFIGDIFNGGN